MPCFLHAPPESKLLCVLCFWCFLCSLYRFFIFSTDSAGYVNDAKEGHGTFSWPDGRSYRGQWAEGKQSLDSWCFVFLSGCVVRNGECGVSDVSSVVRVCQLVSAFN